MTNEDRMQFVYEALGACYWCARVDCEHHVEIARKIVDRWEADLDDNRVWTE